VMSTNYEAHHCATLSVLQYIYDYLFINFYLFVYLLTFRCRFPVSPLTPYSISFLQSSFTERGALKESILFLGRGFTVMTILTQLHLSV
jgi:hypothetical protein